MRKVFSGNLPNKEGFGANKDKKIIDWGNSIGCIVRFIYDDIEGEIEIINYERNGQYLTIKYNENTLRINTTSFIKCNIGRLLNKYTSNFKVDLGKIFKDSKRDLIIIDKEYKQGGKNNKVLKWYKYKCNKCGWSEGWMEESKLINGVDCSCCYGRTAVLGINTIWDTDRWMCDLGVREEDSKKYTKGSNETVIVKCPDCMKEKKIKINNMYNNKSIGCICGDGNSYPEKFISSILKQLDIDYIHQLSKTYFTWCDKYRYDFYLSDYNCVIEAHGIQHYDENARFKRTLMEEKKNDENKKELALSKGVEVYVVIDCRISDSMWIKNSILNTELVDMLDFSRVDWGECEKYALSNLTKQVCDYWLKKNDSESIADLVKVFNLGKSTIYSYLNKGTNLGWCNYDAKEEMRKSGVKNSKLIGKSVEIFNGKNSLGKFESVAELSRRSEEIFGTRLLTGNICMVATGLRKHYKGYIFKYI